MDIMLCIAIKFSKEVIIPVGRLVVDAVQCQVTLNNERQPVWCDSGQQKVLQRPDVSLEEKTHNQKVAKETLQSLSSKAWGCNRDCAIWSKNYTQACCPKRLCQTS